MLALSILSLNPRFYKRVGTTYCLLFPHRGRAVEPAVALAVEAGAGAHVEKERVEGAVCYVDRSACGNEAGAYSDSAAGTVFPVVVERRQVTKVAGVDAYAVITVQFHTARRICFFYIAHRKVIRYGPKPLSLYADSVYVDGTVRCCFVI